ncbi:MAG: hypothetical protein HYS05_03680 [Acidobacteria bacterium]|nr:hypothetical protein [Acidobacteriota bacterium]
MATKSCRVFVVALLPGLSATAPRADVKTQEKGQVRFEGMLGRMVGLFGGRAAREGVVSTVVVQGNRKMTVNDTAGQIVDLSEQKVYDLDMRTRSYQVTTFDEIRRRMQEAQAKAREQAAKSSEPGTPSGKEGEREYEIDFSLKESGQRKTINGYDTREVVMTISVKEKGKTLEEGGGMVLTANSWLAPPVAAMKEIADFDLKYMKALGEGMALGSAEQMAAALAMYPALKQALGRFEAENVNMDGTPIMTTMTVETVAGPQQQTAQEEKRDERPPTGVGGILGGLGRRVARKKEDPAQAGNRKTFMTMTHEVMSVSTSVAAGDVAIPTGFKENK